MAHKALYLGVLDIPSITGHFCNEVGKVDTFIYEGHKMKQKVCAKCGVLKNLSEFKIRLSRTKAKSLGYSGLNTVETESKNCKACRPKPKPKPKRVPNERQIKAMDIPDRIKGVMLKAYRLQQAEARAKMAQGVKDRWDNITKAKWRPIRDAIQDEYTSVTRQLKYTEDKAVIDYCETYLGILTDIRNEIRDSMAKAKKPAPKSWLELVVSQDVFKVRHTWLEIEPNRRNRMREPLILKETI